MVRWYTALHCLKKCCTQTEPARLAGLVLLLNGDVHCFNASGTDKMDGRTRLL